MHKVDRIELLPANAFSIRALTAIYNQSRADYLVAMPMSESQLQDYLDLYDIDLACSVVVRRGERFLGLGMLGVRDEHSWITRLGVLAQGRRTGVAKKIVSYLLAQAIELGHRQVLLEVIHGNAPARRLFEGFGFQSAGELVVLRRPAQRTVAERPARIEWLGNDEAIQLLNHCPNLQPWTNQLQTFENARDTQALRCSLPDGTGGWLIFRRQHDLLSHYIFQTTAGKPAHLAAGVLACLHARFPDLRAKVENIPSDDPHLPALQQFEYAVAFRRIEMIKPLPDA